MTPGRIWVVHMDSQKGRQRGEREFHVIGMWPSGDILIDRGELGEGIVPSTAVI
jgi:hypothetical protein